MKKIFVCLLACMLSGCTVNINSGGALPASEEVAETVAPVVENTAPAVEDAAPVKTKSVALTEAPAGKSVFATLSSEEKTKLNIFFSNFAEAYINEYDCENISANDLICFAFIHNKLNKTSKEEWDMFTSPFFDYVMGIRVEVMDKIIDKYFGVSVPHEDTVSRNAEGRYVGWAFKDGYVYTEASEGEFYDFCAYATDLADLGDGTYSAKYDKYRTGFDMMNKKYYSYTLEQAQNDPELEYCASYTAIIKPAVVDGKNTWYLLKLEEI